MTEPLKVATDQEADATIAVLGPKRVAVALALLGCGLVVANWDLIEIKPLPKKAGREKKRSVRHRTMIASIVNEMPQIEHAHVLLGLAVAIDAAHEELYARRKKGSGTPEPGNET